MRSKKPSIKKGKGAKPVKRSSYPFDDLKQYGDWFGVEDRSREGSVRAQASKQQKSRGVKYKVQRVEKGEEPFKLSCDGVVVIFDSYAN